MPKIIHEGTGIYSATLLLKWTKNNSWIWTGRNEIHTNTSEKPLILEFSEKKFYFYSTELEKNNDKKTWNEEWKTHKLSLNHNDEIKMIKKLEKCIDHNDWNWKSILLNLKVNRLGELSKNLTKEFKNVSFNSIASLNPKTKNFKEEIDYLKQWFKYNHNKLRNLKYRINAYDTGLNKSKIANTINQKIKEVDTSINTLINNLPNLTKKLITYKIVNN